MKRLIVPIAAAVVLAAGLGLQQAQKSQEHKRMMMETGQKATVIGELVDAYCFVTSDGTAMGTGHAQCASNCMGKGIPAGILPEEDMRATGKARLARMRWLLIDPVQLAPYASDTIKVEGFYYEPAHALKVDKLFIKKGDQWTEITLPEVPHAG